jgi:hypothetical protein
VTRKKAKVTIIWLTVLAAAAGLLQAVILLATTVEGLLAHR